MTIDTFDDLFMHLARDAYQAEKQHAKALPGLARKASNPELRRTLDQHLKETKQQAQRLETIFRNLKQEKPRGEVCEAAEGLIREAEQIMGEVNDEQVRDAAIIAAAQAMEHYEIARYGTLVAWAQRKGHREAVRLLQQTLKEEHNANQLLSRLAEQSINEEAMENGNNPVPDRRSSPNRSGGKRRAQPARRSQSSNRRSGARQSRPAQGKGAKRRSSTSAGRRQTAARDGRKNSRQQRSQSRGRKTDARRRASK